MAWHYNFILINISTYNNFFLTIQIKLTEDFGTLPRIVMYLLAFSLATRILCGGAIVLLKDDFRGQMLQDIQKYFVLIRISFRL